MNTVLTRLAETHLHDLDREARQGRLRAAARDGARPTMRAATSPVTIRLGTPADGPALKRLAELDSSDVPAGPILLAEVDGELRAATSLSDRAIIADPFHQTAAYVKLLVTRAEQLLGERPRRLRRLRAAISGRAGRYGRRGVGAWTEVWS